MGLDMYLKGKRFLWSHGEPNERAVVGKSIAEAFPEVAALEIDEIHAEVAYWRKANAIHAWFVTNVQDGEDDCGNYEVSRDHLQALLNDVNQVLEAPELAASKLPTQGGFFFGNTDYDEYYIQDLQYTKERIELLLTDAYKAWDFEYHSSW